MRNWLGTLRYSLTARLMLLFLVVGTVILLILNVTIGLALKHQFERNLRPHLVQYLHYVQREIGDPPDIERARDLARRVGIDIHIRGPSVNWSSVAGDWDPGAIQFRRPPRRPGRGPGPPPHLRPFAIGDDRDRLVFRTRLGRHTAYLAIPRRTGPGHAAWVLLAATGGVLFALFIMYRMIRRLFQPVQTIKRAVQQFGAGDLTRRVAIGRKDELAELGESINDMADDIQQMLEAKRQLLLAASHELRSPITRARVSAELLDDSKLKQNLIRDLYEMETLIAEILETERLNTRHAVLNRAPVLITQTINDVLDTHFSQQTIQTRLPALDYQVLLDGTRFRLLIVNLLSNALLHSEDSAKPPELTITGDRQGLTICVRDFGPGIAAEDLPHVTQPFYRADASRQRKTGGYGLGLYLCRLIAEAHGGRLSIDSHPGAGTTVSVDIPVTDQETA